MTIAATAGKRPTAAPLRLPYLDGIRRLAALFVVICHANLYRQDVLSFPAPLAILLKPLNYGHYAVAVFIVLSGYCLALPVARSTDRQLRGGFWDYIKRRARRILPPYYIALALSLLIDLLPFMQRPHGLIADMAQPAFHPVGLIEHVLLLHNLDFAQYTRINSPLWSVAPEWQIYFLFPLLLIPIWRRFGTVAATVAAITLGFLPFWLPDPYNLYWTSPWYLGLFGLGMAGARLTVSEVPRTAHLRRTFPWGIATLAAVVAMKLLWRSHPLEKDYYYLWIGDQITGLGTVCLLLFCAVGRERNLPLAQFLNRLLASRPIAALGAISYSLYLTHFPISAIINIAWLHVPLSPMERIPALLLTILPICLAFAALFYYWFERPFVSHPSSPSSSPPAKITA